MIDPAVVEFQMAIAPAVLAALIAGGSGLAGTGIQAFASKSSQKKAAQEAEKQKKAAQQQAAIAAGGELGQTGIDALLEVLNQLLVQERSSRRRSATIKKFARSQGLTP